MTVTSRPTPLDALKLLKTGNVRFVSGKPECGSYGPRVAEFARDPYPFAVVLGCSDARVPIETIFDQSPGNLFVVRVAGNFINDDNLASIEFAVDILGASLILVLGHSHCGAVRAANTYVETGVSPRGHIPQIVNKLVPSIQATRNLPGDWFDNATVHNVARNVDALLGASEIISTALDAGEILARGGIYDVMTGEVDFK
jgi:carbonic anhydrase